MFKKTKNTSDKRLKNKLFKIFLSIVLVFAILLALAFGINWHVMLRARKNILNEDTVFCQKSDAILVLGCGVVGSSPSLMLKDRLDAAIELYKKGVSPKIIMSGDHGSDVYNEVGVMKLYAVKKGVPAKDIFMDHAGFSTYESLYRAKEVFGSKNITVVTQKYHLYRALYLGKSLDISVYGYSADTVRYIGQSYRDLREIMARDKDFFVALTKPVPATVKTENIDITGSGNITNDDYFYKLAERNDIDITNPEITD